MAPPFWRGRFKNIAAESGLAYGSDGNFINLGGGHFADITDQAGPDFNRRIVGRGVAVGDYDGDGRLDLLVVDAEGDPRLLHNEGTRNHFLNLRCRGIND